MCAVAVSARRIYHGALDHFLWIVNIARAYPVHDLGGPVAQHALGAGVEQLDDAFLVGGDDREIGARKDRALQGARFEQRLLAPRCSRAIRRAGIARQAGTVFCSEHGR